MIDIDNADKAELKAYARDELGLSLTLNMNEDTMRQKIRDAEEGGAEVKNAPTKTTVNKSAGRVRIVVQKTSEKGGGQPAFVGVNGKGYNIPRGIEVDVPPEVEYVLRMAKQDIIEQDPDESGKLTTREVLTYPYQVVGGYENLFKDDKAA